MWLYMHMVPPTSKPHTCTHYLPYIHTRYSSTAIVSEACQSVGETDLTTLNWLIIEQNKNSQQHESSSILKPLKLSATSVNLQTLLSDSILLKLDKEKQMDRPSLSMLWHADWSKKRRRQGEGKKNNKKQHERIERSLWLRLYGWIKGMLEKKRRVAWNHMTKGPVGTGCQACQRAASPNEQLQEAAWQEELRRDWKNSDGRN